ncbi:solute carrier family 46 member 3-like isoform X2 [Sipha flava]|uniref:Solute carrier family 46 member 3-like isoform X2 n=1 Tax=Sipha flava TaxID=143950 RepID=A0A8B8GP74_9HEMI|nr:solute carrier family 46 member 3-like isoform X2 [Sipha flava]
MAKMTYETGAAKREKSSAQDENHESWQAMSIMSKAKFMLKHCTVEPMLGCYIVSSVLASLATQNLNLQKACRVNLRLDNTTCSALESRSMENYTKEDEVIVQELVADMIIWKTIVQSSIPSVLIIFIGSWSDRNHKRKPCMLIPIIGEFLTSIGLLLCTYYFYELPMEVAGLVESVPPAMTGGWMTMFMAVFSYVGDVTTVKMRTLRIGIVNVFCSVGVPIGTALSGVLFRELGFYENKTETSVERKKEPSRDTSCVDFLKDFFSLSHIKEAIRVTFKEGQHNRRLRIISLMVVVIVVMGPLHGEMSVMYLFTRVRFNWDEVNYSMFSTYSMITNLVGTMFSVGVFSHMLQIDDALIGVMSCVSKILAGFVYAFATTDFVFYLAPLVDIVNGTSFIAMRSIISKLVPPDELGKVNSLFGVCEALVPLIYGPMYSAVYKATLKTVPGAFFLLGGALTAPAALIFLWMYNEHRKERKEKEAAINDEEKKPGVLKKKNSLDFRLSSHDFDLKTILDRRTQTHRGSGQFSSFGLDNIAFQMEEGVRAKASPKD